MKKILLLLFVFTLLFQYKAISAVLLVKSEVNTDYGIIKGTITIASSKKEQVNLTLYEDMQIFTDDARVIKQNDGYIVTVDELSPVILSYIKRPTQWVDRISDDFISIYSSIIPYISNIEKAEIYLTLPQGFSGLLSELFSVDEVSNKENTFCFTFNKMPKSIYLAAAKDYVIKTVIQNNVKIFTLLFKEHENLSYQILQKSAYYIEMYENLFNAKFPYDSFMVVEDELPFGHALNGMAVFGKAIIDKPFIYERSLGHEVLHQYFGSGIECSMKDGNFLEAITTYFSDYFYEKENRIDYRKGAVLEYTAYNNTGSKPLKDFVYNSSKKEQALGYGKGLMVLHMAKNIVGEDAFMNGIRAFIKDKMYSSASWYDLLSYIGTDDEFYNTWILQDENIALYIDNITYRDKELAFNIIIKGGHPQVLVPFIHIHNGEYKGGNILTNAGSNAVTYKLKDDNDTFIIDGSYHLMRYLYNSEITPAFNFIFGSDEVLYAGSRNTDKIFKDTFKNIEEVVHIRKLSLHHIKNKNIIISLENQVPANVAELLKGAYNFIFNMGETTYAVIKNPYSKGDKFIMFAFNADRNTLKRLNHYGTYSYIAFKDNNIVDKKEDKTLNGIKIYGK